MNNKKIIFAVVGVAVIALLVFFGLQKRGTSVPPPPPASNPATPAAVPTVSTPTITKAVMSRSIDTQGRSTGEANVFSAKTDKIIYAVLTLQNILKTTKLSYVRYLNGKYVDSKVAQPSKNGATSFYFVFEKGIGTYPVGAYKLNLYVDGKRSTSVTYTFK